MTSLYQQALQKLGLRQRAYKLTFPEGSFQHQVLNDLAQYSRAFDADADGLSEKQLLMMHGRRQMFFRLFTHLKLTPTDMEMIARNALLHAAARMAKTQGANDE